MQPVRGLPYGLAMALADGQQVTITALSNDTVCLRLAEEKAFERLEFRFLQNDRAGYGAVLPEKWEIKKLIPAEIGWECELHVQDARFASESMRLLKMYAAYIRLKMTEDDEWLSSELTGCPYEAVTAEALDSQKRSWFSGCSYAAEGEWSLALTADRPELYAALSEKPWEKYQRSILQMNHLEQHKLFEKRADRVYIGNAFCAGLLPEQAELARMLRQMENQCVSVTLVLPSARERELDKMTELLRFAYEAGVSEAVINDWGMLECCASIGIEPVLGVLLNRRRKDPRLPWKSGFAQADMGQNALNGENFRKWLAGKGVHRYEYETCGYPIAYAEGSHSLHLPFYQTNTSHDCPLAAACLGSDPGASVSVCEQICQRYARLYPDWMGLVGRYNSLFGIDRDALKRPDTVQHALENGIDRLVLDIL